MYYPDLTQVCFISMCLQSKLVKTDVGPGTILDQDTAFPTQEMLHLKLERQ
jgi:hypothetical protein